MATGRLVSTLSTLTLTLFACGGGASDSPATTPAKPAPAPTTEAAPAAASDVESACVAVMQHMRTCSQQFIPALVDLRIKYDRPAGIADAAKQAGRDALVAKAFEEWKTDSSDDHLAATCSKEAREIPVVQQLIDAGRACLSKTDCDDAVACVIPLIEAPWKQ